MVQKAKFSLRFWSLKITWIDGSRSPLLFERCHCAHFSTYAKIGTNQRRIAWALHKDDTQILKALHIKKKRIVLLQMTYPKPFLPGVIPKLVKWTDQNYKSEQRTWTVDLYVYVVYILIRIGSIHSVIPCWMKYWDSCREPKNI